MLNLMLLSFDITRREYLLYIDRELIACFAFISGLLVYLVDVQSGSGYFESDYLVLDLT